MVGIIVTLPDWSIEIEEAMFMSRLRTIGEEPTVRLGLKLTVAVIGPDMDFCINCIVFGSMYMTVPDDMLMLAPEYVPWGTFIRVIGLTVPMRCIISTGVEEVRTLTLPPLPLVSIIDPIVMLTATRRSDGASPIFTCKAVVFGWGFGFEEELPLPPQPMSEIKNMLQSRHTVNLKCDDSILLNNFMAFSSQ
jgi:hypothetical protein